MNISIVTPLRDEIDNLPGLIDSIERQSHRIRNWILLENGSIDGSREYLENIKSVKNVDNFLVINLELSNNEYQLGLKYSGIVKYGFDFIVNNFEKSDYDLIGILDADNFPSNNYYECLVDKFLSDSNIGILSGVVFSESGKPHPNSKDVPRGSCRLWRRDCFEDSGYVVSMSADSVSSLKARLRGWKTFSLSNARVTGRLVGSKSKYFEYYGKSVYFRGYSPLYAIFRVIKHFIKLDFSFSFGFFKGYFSSFLKSDKKIEDVEILKYNRFKLLYKLKDFLRV